MSLFFLLIKSILYFRSSILPLFDPTLKFLNETKPERNMYSPSFCTDEGANEKEKKLEYTRDINKIEKKSL